MYCYPQLKEQDLKGSVVYYDGQHNDARANVCLAMTAAKHGGVILNHTRFASFTKNGAKITGVDCVDELDGSAFRIEAKSVINATGPYSDNIRKLDDPTVKELCVPSAGVRHTSSLTLSPLLCIKHVFRRRFTPSSPITCAPLILVC